MEPPTMLTPANATDQQRSPPDAKAPSLTGQTLGLKDHDADDRREVERRSEEPAAKSAPTTY